MPPVREQLLNANLDNPIQSVLEFLDAVPDCLQEIFEDSVFIDSCKPIIEHSLFMEAFYEARSVLQLALKDVRNELEANEQFRGLLMYRLSSIGFTGKSLEMKAAILKRFDSARRRAKQIGNYFLKHLRTFLKQLNVFLGSLSSAIPGIDAIKEVKDTSEIIVDANPS